MKNVLLILGAVLVSGLLLAACTEEANPLAPYEGERPLTLLKVTQSFTPDVQWVGGRVAAVGVNRGAQAALDSTLVWLMTADLDTISSHVTVGEHTDEAAIRQYGGTPVDSLDDETAYTFWLAEKSVFDAGLEASNRNEFTFVDTTVTMQLVLSGRVRGGLGLDIKVTRDENLLGEQFFLEWTPGDVPVRRIAIRKGAASPAFTNLVWHVVLPDEAADSVHPPVVIGETPPGMDEVTAWPDEGFEPDTYTLWLVNSDWDGSFGFNPPGMGYIVLFATNFD